jgi:hypothetical protein
METAYNFPKLVNLVLSQNIKLRLRHCKVVLTQAGVLCVVAPVFGEGYYGRFRDATFNPNKTCTEEIIAELQDVEDRGMAAVKEIGMLTGCCCICGRTLTDDYSIANGIGPICAGKVVGWDRNESLEAL